VEWNERGLRVFWAEFGGGRTQIYSQRVHPDGAAVGAPQTLLDAPGDKIGLVSATWSAQGGVYRLVYTDDHVQHDTYLPYYLSVDEDGAVQTASRPLPEAAWVDSWAGGKGDEAHVVWNIRPADFSDATTWLLRLSDVGAAIAPAQAIYRGNVAQGSSVSSDGDFFVGLWDERRGALAVRVSPGVGPSVIPLGAGFERPLLAAGFTIGGARVIGALLPTHRDGKVSNHLSFRTILEGPNAGPLVNLDRVPVAAGAVIGRHLLAYGTGRFAAFWLEEVGTALGAVYFMPIDLP
jgi:hypothetical protein